MIDHRIIVYEHQSLKLGYKGFSNIQLKKMAEFYGEGDCPYYTLINDGVKFKEYVGVIQIGELTIEVLPKTDKQGEKKEEQDKWRSVLIDMLRKSGILKVAAPTSSNLSIRRNNILDLYFELFLSEIERLLHEGLIKKYRKAESNLSSLKGKLSFSKHIAHNSVHQERLYCEYTTYDVHHGINQILYKTLKLLSRINTSPSLYSRIGNLLLNFPEMDDLKVTETNFKKITYDRKNVRYKDALNIAELLLLNYHPDVKSGKRHILALMFDMNRLWEKYVFSQLYPLTKIGIQVKEQMSKHFWGENEKRNIIPDIVLIRKSDTFIIDTKWKVIDDAKPSIDDVQQMFAYNMLFSAKKSILLYPKVNYGSKSPEPFVPKLNTGSESHCQVAFIDVVKDGRLSNNIYDDVLGLL